MSQPKISAASVSVLQGDVANAISTISDGLEKIEIYSGFVSPNALRQDPNAYQTVPDIGPTFTPEEIRTILISDADIFGGLAERVSSGPASPYITGDQARALKQLSARANGVIANLKQGPRSAVSDLDLAGQEQEEIAQDAVEIVNAIETRVVAAEAGSVPVLEPYEKESKTMETILGVGIAAALIYAIWRLV